MAEKTLIYKNILVFRTGFLGDLLVTLPAFWTIRESFPAAEITLLTNSNAYDRRLITARQILPEKGLFDDYIDYDVGNNVLFNKLELLKLALKLRAKKIDCLIYFTNRNRLISDIKRDKWFFRLCGISKTIGMNYLIKNLVDYNIQRPLLNVEPEFEFFTNCLKTDAEFNDVTINQKTDLLLTSGEIEFGENWIIENCGNVGGKKLIAIAPGSKWESKTWGAEKFIQVIEHLIVEHNILPVIFGGEEDFETGEKIIEKSKVGVNAAGKLSVRQSAAVLKNCEFYLGNDTGTMHLAASVGLSCVAIFSAIDFPNRWTPVGHQHKIFRRHVSCEGCHSPICRNNKLCVELIKVEEVVEACRQILKPDY